MQMSGFQRAALGLNLGLAVAMAASNPPLMREIEQVFEPVQPAKPKTKADLDRIAAAQAKRERRANKTRGDL